MTLVPNCPSLPLWIKSKTIKQKVLISKNNSSIFGDSFLTYYSWKEINSRWLPHPLYKTYCCSLSPNQNGPLTSFLIPSTLNKGLFFVLTDILPHNTRKDRKLYPIPSLTLVIWIVLFFWTLEVFHLLPQGNSPIKILRSTWVCLSSLN